MSNLTLDEINAAITEVAEIARQAQEIINNPTVFYTSRTIEAGVKHMTECKRAYQTSLAALRECAERRENKPLTVEEVRERNGKPVWKVLCGIGYWTRFWLCDYEQDDFDDYGKTWLAYDHEPERSETK